MRVICEKCRSAYGVDDALVPAGGVRSQCPRCRHIQLARPVRSTGVRPKLASPPSPVGAEQGAAEFDAAMSAAIRDASPVTAGAAVPGASIREVSPVTAGAAAPSTAAAGGPSKGSAGPGPSAPPPLPSARSAAVTPACASCGKPLSDPFDQALGQCDACRQQEKEREQQSLSSSLFGDGLPSEPPAPAPIAPLESVRTTRINRPQMVVMSASRDDGATSRKWPWVVGLLVLAGGGAGAWYWSRGGTTPAAREAPLPAEAERIVAHLRARHPGLSGTRESLMSRAEDRLLADREAAYREARELFEELVTLDPRDARIVAGYAEAIALGPAPGAEALADAETLVRAVKAKGTDAGLLWAARADLTLAHGGADAADDARKLAEASLRELTGKDRAFGELALGRTYAASSGKLAVEAFSAALEADPAQRRALVLRGLARESLGDYREARKDLQNRLAMDPDHWRTLDALARIELDGGEVSQAARLFQRAKEAHPSDLRPILALAELHAFADHHPERAVALLETARKEHSSPSPAQKAALEAHLAAAYRLQGMLTLGEKAGAAALEADPQNVTAHLQLALIALARHKPKDALPHLSAIEGKLKAPGLVKLLEGRARFADGDFAGAAESFGAAVAADPRRMDAALWAGVASAAAGNRQKAEEWGLKVAQADPFHLAPDAEFGPNFVSSAELLDGAEGVYAKLSRGETDVMPDLLEGVVRYFQKDLPGAERSLRTVLASDTGNVIAHAYLALVEAAQKSAQAAVASGAKAVAFGRQFGVAHYAYGEALLAAGQEDAAKRELEQVRLLAPSLLGAEFQLAQLEAKRAPDAARDRLARLLSIDGAYGPARRALYQLDKE